MASRAVLSAALVAAVAVTMVGAAEAQSRKKNRGGDGVVTVCSIYGNGCATAPVRRASNDHEFRLPGGTWISCRQSCKDTLRRETVDFWETQRENGGSEIN